MYLEWLAFSGGGSSPRTSRAEQRKIIKYIHVLANWLNFHTYA
jgi:hypothetical protein